MKGSRYSGQFILRISPDLHRTLASQARDRGVSLNAHCGGLLEQPHDPGAGSLPIARLRKLYEEDGLIGIILFGSQARGTARESSDHDLFLIFESKTRIQRELYRRWEKDPLASSPTPISIHASAYIDPKQRIPNLWLEVAWDGRVLWQKDPKVGQVLSQIRDQIAGGAYQRRTAHGQRYWVRDENQ